MTPRIPFLFKRSLIPYAVKDIGANAEKGFLIARNPVPTPLHTSEG